MSGPKSLPEAEAPGGFEPPHRGFADLCLTTWLRRRGKQKLFSVLDFSNPSAGMPHRPPRYLWGTL